MLTFRRQSKLSPQQLEELQKSTHFDKKELQQWYKGGADALPASGTYIELVLTKSCLHRIPQRLSIGHFDQRRVPKDLPAILSLWRSDFIRRLCFQGV